MAASGPMSYSGFWRQIHSYIAFVMHSDCTVKANIYTVASTCADVIFVNKSKTLSEIVECSMFENVCLKIRFMC